LIRPLAFDPAFDTWTGTPCHLDTGRAMSRENVDLRAMAEAAFGALNSGNLDGFLALATEDVEFTWLVAEVEGMTGSATSR
jgi:hypothetical protein